MNSHFTDSRYFIFSSSLDLLILFNGNIFEDFEDYEFIRERERQDMKLNKLLIFFL